jgi:hypothetical protein
MDVQNTQVVHIPLTLTTTDPTTGAVTVVPVPAGDTFSAVSSAPASLGVAIGLDASGHQELVGTPLVLESSSANGGGNITVTVTDSAGDTAGELTGANAINIVTVPVVDAIALGAPTFTTQAAPTAPGP